MHGSSSCPLAYVSFFRVSLSIRSKQTTNLGFSSPSSTQLLTPRHLRWVFKEEKNKWISARTDLITFHFLSLLFHPIPQTQILLNSSHNLFRHWSQGSWFFHRLDILYLLIIFVWAAPRHASFLIWEFGPKHHQNDVPLSYKTPAVFPSHCAVKRKNWKN